jgi:aryl-alcohol dehydrogenase-like predicted oxidoreductase
LERRKLGRTGLPVSRMGLGLAALGRPGYINIGHATDLEHDYDVAAMRRRTGHVLDVAWAAGVRYFDAARSYGRAEEFLAGWLTERAVPPTDVTVGSKWGYTYTAAWRTVAAHHEVKEHSLEVLERQVKESRDWLGHHLDVYHVHSATLDSGILGNQAVLTGLARLRDQGLAIGISLSGPRQADTLRAAMAVRVADRPLFDCVQATWNILERSAAATLAEAHASGMGVIIKEGVANGRLTQRNLDPRFARQRATLEVIAARLRTTVDAVALAAIVARPWADVVLSGATTVEQLESNLAALTLRWDDAIEEELQPLTESAEEYWATRAKLAWN